ncbi:MAG: hypothetical protein EA426_19770 [Spirochaetaceae bacterium]|nr:MAG: hypothetical protein EA426_19770 [Spirochaetaceae bacterium]
MARKVLMTMTVMVLSFVVVFSAFAGGKAEEEVAPAAAPAVTAAPGEYNEAPMFAAMVRDGRLPPVEERLPENPLVIVDGINIPSENINFEIGRYGGPPLRSVTVNPELDWTLRDANMNNFLMTPIHTTGPIRGNIAESFTISDDNRVYTITLRKGLKWSDGVPVTTEDVRFAWEGRMLNTDLTPVVPAAFRAGGRPGAEVMTLEIIDDFTFRMSFAEPYGRFARQLGAGQLWGGYNELLKPSHYLKQFHIDYTPIEDIRPHLQDQGLSDAEWFRLFLSKDILWHQIMASHAPGFPSLNPWLRVDSPDELIRMERNPYFYKVDAAGNQLPYIDRYESVVVADPESIPLAVIAGDVNFNRDLIAHEHVGLLLENAERGGYEIELGLVYHNAPIALFFNYNNPDPTWQSVVLDRRFRHAVNLAMDNQTYLDVVFLGMGTTSPWFPGGHDKARANQLLDEMGMDQRDSEGYRLAPNGERFEVYFEFYEAAADWARIVELIREDLEEVGIRTPIRQIANELWVARRDAFELFATVDWLDDTNWPYLTWDFMPNTRMQWGGLWHEYLNTDGASGVEPPDWIVDLYELETELRSVRMGTARAEAAEQRLADWMMENVPMFPVAHDVVSPTVRPANLRNVAHSFRSMAAQSAAEMVFYGD